MKLTELSKKPELVKVVLDDEDTVKEFGEPLEFWTLDRTPLDIFTKLANANQSNPGDVVNTVRQLILDEDGRQVIAEGRMLPPLILTRAIAKLVNKLGN